MTLDAAGNTGTRFVRAPLVPPMFSGEDAAHGVQRMRLRENCSHLVPGSVNAYGNARDTIRAMDGESITFRLRRGRTQMVRRGSPSRICDTNVANGTGVVQIATGVPA